MKTNGLGAGGTTGVITVPAQYTFADNTARDTYFTAHPTEKVLNLFIIVGSAFQEWSGSAWVVVTSIAQGPAGTNGSAGSAGAAGAAGTNGAGYTATSATSLAISNSASRAFTTQAGLAYVVGTRVRAFSTGSNAYMEGVCTAYSGTTLTVTMDHSSGTGTHTDWTLSVAGDKGADGSGGGSAPASISYATAMPLDSVAGYTMDVTFLQTNDTITIDGSPAPTDGGFVTGVWISDGTHIPTQPAGVISAGGSFTNVAGRWNCFTYAKIGDTIQRQITAGYLSPVLDTAIVANGNPSHVTVSFLADLDQSGSAASQISLFAISGKTIDTAAWGTSKQIVLHVTADFTAAEAETISFTNAGGGIYGVDTAGYAINFSSVTIDNQVVDLGNFRWLTVDPNITESGSGPYTYTINNVAGGNCVLAALKFPASVDASIIFTKAAVTTPSPNNEFTRFKLSTDNSGTGEVTGINIGVTASFDYDCAGVDTSVVIGTGSQIKIRRMADNTIKMYTQPDTGGGFTEKASLAGSAVDYYLYMGMASGGGVGHAYEATSQSGMVAA